LNLKLDKLNRVAVLLAGDFRSWPRAAEYIFAFAERQAITVDYYFATWTTTQDFWYTTNISATKKRLVTKYNITCEFAKHNKNLINFQLVNQIKQPNTITKCTDVTFYYQTYLAKLAGLMKRRYELDNNFVYDQVFEMRPDLYIYDEVNSPLKLADFEWSGKLSYDTFRHHETQWPVAPTAQDLYYQANSFGNDVLAERYYYRKSIEYTRVCNDNYRQITFSNNHWVLFDYSYLRRLQPVALTHPNIQLPIRSNFPQDDLRNYSQPQLQEYIDQYNSDVKCS
jgi:hypothetical protein